MVVDVEASVGDSVDVDMVCVVVVLIVVVWVVVVVVVVDGPELVSQPELPSYPPFMYLFVSVLRPPPE